MKLYSNTAVEKLANKYIEKGGFINKITDSVLLEYGLAIFSGDNLISCIVKDVYINEWSSAYSVKFYNKLPKKYQLILDNN